MARLISYRDAVRLLGGDNSTIVARLDQLFGGLLLGAAAATGHIQALGLFGAKAELVRLSSGLIRELSVNVSGVSRFTRSERLIAAHAVVVVMAYFEALNMVELPFDVDALELTKSDEIGLIIGGSEAPQSLAALAEKLLCSDIPIPTPERPHDAAVALLKDFYTDLSKRVHIFLSGLYIWDSLTDGDRRKARKSVESDLPRLAVQLYDDYLRRLAADFAEFAFWANLTEHEATRTMVRQLGGSLAGIEDILATMRQGHSPDGRRLNLARSYHAALKRPILASEDTPAGLVIPELSAAYINPQFRAISAVSNVDLTSDTVWKDAPVRNDITSFLTGHLTAPSATEIPLLILGQPGSGKSLLTTILAARLPATEFLSVRVPLRDVPADAELQTQVEYAVRNATGETVHWPDLARSADDALCLILLDGFDELLQATGVNQSDYLERIVSFQRRESDQGRPTAVIVTSRTAVADRARIPDGSVIVRLEPFTTDQTDKWLRVWNDSNRDYFEAHGLRPLSPDTVRPHSDLASEPLLLTMLALYDADENALQRMGADHLTRADLYERLLMRFARREVRKSAANLSNTQLDRSVDHELLRLSATAFAMLNRGRQWVTDRELDVDLAALGVKDVVTGGAGSLRAELTSAEKIFGRFFFVHRAQVTRDEARLSTYEFLHATFGEYLVARLVTRELLDLVRESESITRRSRPASVDDSFLYAVLSFSVLSERAATIGFLEEIVEGWSQRRRDVLLRIIRDLFATCLQSRQTSEYTEYEPVRLAVPARPAAYSANLFLLAVIVGNAITSSWLYSNARGGAWHWRSITLLWRSQLASEAWTSLVREVALERRKDRAGRRYLSLRLAGGKPLDTHVDPDWHRDGPPFGKNTICWSQGRLEDIRRELYFTCDGRVDMLLHALEPLAGVLDGAVEQYYVLWQDRTVSAMHALLTIFVNRGTDDELARAYDVCLDICQAGMVGVGREEPTRIFRELVTRQLQIDLPRMSATWAQKTAARLAGRFHDEWFAKWLASVLET